MAFTLAFGIGISFLLWKEGWGDTAEFIGFCTLGAGFFLYTLDHIGAQWGGVVMYSVLAVSFILASGAGVFYYFNFFGHKQTNGES